MLPRLARVIDHFDPLSLLALNHERNCNMELNEMYRAYLLERREMRVVEDPKARGFATFNITPGKAVYVQDAYVGPEFRRSGVMTELGDAIVAIARAEGCTLLYGSVDNTVAGATESMKALLAYGFRLLTIDGARIILVKDI